MRVVIYLFVLVCGIFILRRKPLLSPTNLLFAYIIATIIFGDFFLPLSMIADRVVPTSDMAASLNLYFYLSVVAFLVIAVGFFMAGRVKMLQLPFGFLRNIDLSTRRLFTICLVYYAIGATLLFLTFHATSTIPYFEETPFAAKYFQHKTSIYVPYRPFYVLAIDIVAIASLFTAYLAVKSLIEKHYSRSLLYIVVFLLMFATNVLTVKRGEIIMPLFVLLSAFAIAGRIRLPTYLIGLLSVGIIAIGLGMNPMQIAKRVGMVKKTVQKVEEIEKAPVPYGVLLKLAKTNPVKCFTLTQEEKLWFFRGVRGDILRRAFNSFFVELREGGRFLNGFRGHDLFLGKTFMAGIISLIPTQYSSFKDQYVIGRVSMRLFGSNPETGGGPQIGYVAESYANFGIAGVLVISLLLGFFMQRLDTYYLGIYNDGIKEKMLIMLFIFLITFHIRGFYTNGSGIFQPFMVRTLLYIPIYYFAMRNSAVKERFNLRKRNLSNSC